MAFYVKAIVNECQSNGPNNDLSSFRVLCTLTQNIILCVSGYYQLVVFM